MTAQELRQKYLDFFISKGHKIIPPAPLIPENDPTTLFTSSGMQQLVPYLKGKPHSQGKKLVNSQPCFRAQDIEVIGDNHHTTFFEMLGNWSLGDYFKEKQLRWVWEFLTSSKWINLPKEKLYVTVFEGDEKQKVVNERGKPEKLKPDIESVSIWRGLLKFDPGIPIPKGEKGFDSKIKIYEYGATENWWSRSGPPENMPPGEIGGPDSEIFYDFGKDLKSHENSPYENKPCHLNCDCGRFLEIGNCVFMQYEKQKDSTFKPLPKKNVDFGGGLERIIAASKDEPDIFQTDLLLPVIKEIEKVSNQKYEGENKRPMRIIADHLRASTFMVAQGLEPSNKGAGYVLRRLLRRSAVKMWQIGGGLTPDPGFGGICEEVLRIYSGENILNREETQELKNKIINEEMGKFARTLDKGLKIIKKQPSEKVDGKFAFNLFQTYGFPFEITQELFAKKGVEVSWREFVLEYNKHKALSRTASAGMFKGGLADHSETTTKYHTTTHLLHQAMRDVLGDHIKQAGSNITAERLRFDFTHPQSLIGTELKKIEKIINQKIKQNLPITHKEMPHEQAIRFGALAFFKQKYPDQVTVYSIGEYSKELCGGPHVKNTGQIGKIKVDKQKALGQGLRRVYLKFI